MQTTHQYSPRGIPILSLPEKIDALETCLNDNAGEDVVGHLFDLMAYAQGKLNQNIDFKDLALVGAAKDRFVQATKSWTDESLLEFKRIYGSHPNLKLEDKIGALRYCFQEEAYEDVMGHLFDLIAHSQDRLNRENDLSSLTVDGAERARYLLAIQGWTDDSFVALKQIYGEAPTPITDEMLAA